MSEELTAALLSSQAMDEYLELRTGQEIIDDIQTALASLSAEVVRLKANKSNILSVVNCDFNSRRNLG
jgi:hypothetical protein